MDIEEIKKRVAEFESKLKPISEYSPEERAAAKAKWEMEEAEKAARKAKWPEIQKHKGQIIIKGIAVSPGLAEGTVRIMARVSNQANDPVALAKIQTGEVVVAERTEPEDEPYIAKAVAVVTDCGGKVSITAITAKTLGIPAVTGTVEGTSILKDGQKVIVDGTEGVVYTVSSV